jgi:hypothetical protein
MVNAKDPLDVAEADALYPARASAALEALGHGGRCALETETVRQFESDRCSILFAQKTIDKLILRFGPSPTSWTSPARAAARGTRRVADTPGR